eukprot:6458503-Prymnesium_polylepis.1
MPRTGRVRRRGIRPRARYVRPCMTPPRLRSSVPVPVRTSTHSARPCSAVASRGAALSWIDAASFS